MLLYSVTDLLGVITVTVFHSSIFNSFSQISCLSSVFFQGEPGESGRPGQKVVFGNVVFPFSAGFVINDVTSVLPVVLTCTGMSLRQYNLAAQGCTHLVCDNFVF